MKPFLFGAALLLATGTLFAQQQEKHARVKVMLDDNAHNIARLGETGVAVDHGTYKKNTFFVTDLSVSELNTIKASGFEYSVLIEDVGNHYAEQNKATLPAQAKTTVAMGCSPLPPFNDPTRFHLGSYGGYFTYTEMLNILDSMRMLYPGLISAKAAIDTYHTIQGRPIYWVRVSNNPTVEDTLKPQMLYTALHHAREPGSISATIYYLWYLLENYATDPKIKTIIDNTELYFVPCLNPDGYLYNIATNPGGGGMWRKNLRDNGDGTQGVDLNRNYGYFWGYDNIGSSPTTSSQTYRGTAGFSEPETQAVRWFTTHHNFKFNLNYHTFNNDLIYPWGYIASFLTPDSLQFAAYGDYLTRGNHYRYGTGDQTLNYITNGGSDDWMYGDTTGKGKIFAFTPEIGATDFGFYTPIGNITPDCRNNLQANINSAALLLPFTKVYSEDNKIITATTGHLHYKLQRLGFRDTTYTVTFTPLDSWLTVGTAPHSHTGLTMLQEVTDSVTYSIAAATPNGQLLRCLRTVYNGFYYTRDTLSFYNGRLYLDMRPSTSAMTDWVNSGWNVCSTVYHTAPASIGSDASCTAYANNSDLTIKLASGVDLTHAQHAYLNFFSKWGVESTYDYVAVLVSPAGMGAWEPLCGEYTRGGTSYQLHDQPIFDGQQPDWVREEMSLNDFVGLKIDLQFELVSDAGVSYQGFFFDDVQITAVLDSNTAIHQVQAGSEALSVYPNPASDVLTIALHGTNFSTPLHAVLCDYMGRQVMNISLSKAVTTADISRLPAGVYYLRTEGMEVRKLVVIR
jgi:hypothetical protein